MDQGPRQTGAPLRSPRRSGLPKEGDEENAKVGRLALLLVTLGPCSNGLPFARQSDGPSGAGGG